MRFLIITLILLAIGLGIALALIAVYSNEDSGSQSGSPSSSPSPTPTEPVIAPGQTTPNADICGGDELTGAFVSAEGAAGHTILTLEAGDAERDCILTGPPEVRWYGADGAGLGVPYTLGAACAADETDYKTCVYGEPVDLPDSDFNLPIGTPFKVRAFVSVTNIGVLQPCASPTKQAHIVGLQFPGTPLDVQIVLPDDIELQTCSAQVDLVGYGPVLTGSD